MARPTATPESRRDRYGTRGRPLSDWEALAELWHGSDRVRAASNEAFTRYEKHAYAEPATQREAEGRELTELIWSEMRAVGYEVSERPVHFTKVGAPPDAAPPEAEPDPEDQPAGADASMPRPLPDPAPTGPRWAPMVLVAVVVLIVVLALRRRRTA